MSDKTELLVVVEKHPTLYNKNCHDFKDAEKKKNAPLLGGGIHQKYDASVKSGVLIYACISSPSLSVSPPPNYCILYIRWFVRTSERKVAMVAFVVVIAFCINRPLYF